MDSLGIDKALQYMMEEVKESPRAAGSMILRLAKHHDIWEEFRLWLDERNFPEKESALHIEGWCAQDLLSVLEYEHAVKAYNYMVFIRENPAMALGRLKQEVY